MQRFRHHIIFRLICLLMAFHIFNCSVDTPDAKPDYIPEDLSYNDIESVAELILEEVLNIENAIAEHDEKDTEDGNSFDLKKDFVYFHRTEVKNDKNFNNGLSIIALTYYDEQYSSQFHPEIVPPPPKS
jgi:hypothetical protein